MINYSRLSLAIQLLYPDTPWALINDKADYTTGWINFMLEKDWYYEQPTDFSI